MEDDIKRWTAKRKTALILDIIQGKTTVAEASRALVIDPGKMTEAALPIDQGARPAVSIARQTGHLLTDVLKQLVVVSRSTMTATVLPVLRASQAFVDVRSRYA
jgi:hypothetical protein